MRKSTLRDVSRATGLSIFTVSKALNGADSVSELSREQVLKAARELGYIPNRAAQELRKASRDSIAVVTASTSNSYYLDLMAGIQQMLQPSDWTVVVGDVAVNGAYDPALEDRMIRRLIESRTAGVISTLRLSSDNTQLLERWGVPLVFVDSSPPEDKPSLPSVTTDNYNASLMVGEHLAGHGYKRWLFLVYPSKWTSRFDRERGIRDAARLHGTHVEVIESENDPASASAALADYLAAQGRLPDVLITGNTPLLLGAMTLIRERAVRIPDDMALIGFDEFAWAPLIDPPVTVLNERSEEIGRVAARTLAAIIRRQAEAEARGQPANPQYLPEYRQQVPAALVVRRSCGCGGGPHPFAAREASR
ncbi:LacI family DNA-binding transcriptional regulator [Neorhizobium sp. S3-V5DH]|uniref:LacI family DNA-binding transcriptional regulator n=1 Tax=Neorhizobium sp. S3-V5DH TaxID=2485166 RepID=UPI001050387C|nr:LacI family DNA-binding transcriptional regulator [Neorhizobium sp. S3-V5DH]TCV67459.1 LacI family transcriptional regulator [Neorhizobium sp. S3-V5DH]